MDMNFLLDWKRFSFNNNKKKKNDKRYSRLLKKEYLKKLVDQESKVVRDRQDDIVLRDHLHCLQGYVTLFPVKYTHLIFSYTQRCLLKVKRNGF